MEHWSLVLFGIFLSWCCVEYSRGLVTLSPSGVAQVCQGARQQLVMCTTNETLLAWTFVPPLVNNRGVPIRLDWFISSTDLSQQLQQIRANSTTFTFVRTSMRHSSPLVSTMTIINSSKALNMTGVTCTEIVGNQQGTAVSSTIQIIGDIDSQRGITESPLLNMNVSTTPQFGDDDLSVIIEWVPDEGVTYEIMSVPETAVNFLKQSTIRLTLFYNIQYNISIEAIPCGQNRERINTTISLHYATCGHPFLWNQEFNSSNSPVIVGYGDPAVEGSTITISCLSGLGIVGPSTLMCMGNGEWEPDPTEVACTEHTTSSESTTGSTGNVQTDNEVIAAVVIPLVCVFLVTSVIIFFTGFICGHCLGRKSKPKSSAKPETPVPLYKDVLPNAAQHDQGQHDPLELNENVAYGSSKIYA